MEKLKYRYEFKYYLNYQDFQVLKRKLKLLMKLDENANEEGYYPVRSLYFDDYKNSVLFEKLSGVQQRKKYRIRLYNQSDQFILFEKNEKCTISGKKEGDFNKRRM